MLQKLMTVAIALFCLASCSPPQRLFLNPAPKPENHLVLRQYFLPKEPVIQPGDKLSVSIWGHDELSVGSVNSVYNSNEVTGRWVLVDNNGEVNLPRLGRVKVAGFDLREINFVLESKYSEVLKDPIINVKVLNHFVTVLGEVNSPGKYQLDNDNVSLVQAIGMAEGLSPYARGEVVQVIRTVNGRAVELKVDLTDLMVFSEYNVILQPNDVVYISPNEKKGADEKLRRTTAIAGILTGIALVISVFTR